MTGAGMYLVNPCSYWLHALAQQRQHQTRAVAPQSSVSVRMTQPRTQMLKVAVKAIDCIHRSSGVKSRESHYSIYDILSLG